MSLSSKVGDLSGEAPNGGDMCVIMADLCYCTARNQQ